MKKRRKNSVSGSLVTKFINYVLDSLGLLIALGVELFITIVSLTSLVILLYEKMAFAGIGLVVVLFGVRAWMKGKQWYNRTVWFSFALVAIFFNVSFALVSTENQAMTQGIEINESNDPTITRLQENRSQALIRRDEINAQYDQAVRAETVDNILAQQTANEENIIQLDRAILDRMIEIESGRATDQARTRASGLTADQIFNAIPEAWINGRYIPLVLFLVLFIGLETTIITAVMNEIMSPVVPAPPNTPVAHYPIIGVTKKESKKEEEEQESEIVIKRPTDIIQIYAESRFKLGKDGSLKEWTDSLAEAGLSLSEFQKITEKAVSRKLLVIRDGKTFPASFVGGKEFIRGMR